MRGGDGVPWPAAGADFFGLFFFFAVFYLFSWEFGVLAANHAINRAHRESIFFEYRIGLRALWLRNQLVKTILKKSTASMKPSVQSLRTLSRAGPHPRRRTEPRCDIGLSLFILCFFYLRATRKTTQASCATRACDQSDVDLIPYFLASPAQEPCAPCAAYRGIIVSSSLLEPRAAMQYRARLSPRTLQCRRHAAAAPRRVSRPMR